MPGDESIATAPGAHSFPAKLSEPAAAKPPAKSSSPADALSELLRNNEEYMVVHWAAESLKSQLSRAKSDMQLLINLRQQALANPLKYVEALVSDSAPRAPPPQAVVDVPSVYLEPYLSCADPIVIEEYMGIVQSAISADDASRYRAIMSASKHAGGGIIKSTPIRHLPPALSKTALRASRPPSSTNFSLLTGNTAVATPEHSPRRPPMQPALGFSGSAASTAVPDTPFGSIPAANAPAPGSGVVPAVPMAVRANTEPIYCASASVVSATPTAASTAESVSTAGAVAQGAHSLATASERQTSRPSMTQPGTPTTRGQAQKTLTPQILESFRRQLSEEGSMSPAFRAARAAGISEQEASDDDDYYNALVESVSAEYTNGRGSSQASREPATNGQDARAQAAGKALMPNGHQYPQWSPQKRGSRGRGRGRSRGRGASSSKPKGTHREAYNDDGEIKPPSYNLPWTDEEQTRLEELLVIYPSEEVSNNRWRKISEALGTRTMRQVSSRVQKYFIKLNKAGLPVPGRVPNTSSWASMSRTHATTPNDSPSPRPKRRRTAGGSASGSRSKHKYVDFTSSSDEDDGNGVNNDGDIGMYDDLDNFTAAAQPYDRKGKQADRSGNESPDRYAVDAYQLSNASAGGNGMFMSGSNGAGPSSAGLQQPSALRSAKVVHLGYRCDSCFSEPIVGIRWHCLDCRGAQAVDLCDECREEGVFETATHLASHSFRAKREAEMEPFYANEVAAAALREYSYLA